MRGCLSMISRRMPRGRQNTSGISVGLQAPLSAAASTSGDDNDDSSGASTATTGCDCCGD
jgi:hypothetical protein